LSHWLEGKDPRLSINGIEPTGDKIGKPIDDIEADDIQRDDKDRTEMTLKQMTSKEMTNKEMNAALFTCPYRSKAIIF
jgi:hypothetical protein